MVYNIFFISRRKMVSHLPMMRDDILHNGSARINYLSTEFISYNKLHAGEKYKNITQYP